METVMEYYGDVINVSSIKENISRTLIKFLKLSQRVHDCSLFVLIFMNLYFVCFYSFNFYESLFIYINQ